MAYAAASAGAASCAVQRIGTPPPPTHQHHADGAAGEAAIPHQTAATEEGVPAGVQRHEPQLGAEDAADEGAEDDVAGVVVGEVLPAAFAVDEPATDQEGEHHRQAEAGDGQ